MLKIVGTLIAHSLVHEGPGFPYFAPFVYWYIATGCEERALPYVSIRDDLSFFCMQTVKQLLLASSEEEFNVVLETPDFSSLLELSGCRRLPCFANKDAIAQDFTLQMLCSGESVHWNK
jgi:hypothetical protein